MSLSFAFLAFDAHGLLVVDFPFCFELLFGWQSLAADLKVWIRHCNIWICTHWHTEGDLLLRLEEKTLTWCRWDVFEKTLQSPERTAFNI